MHIFPLNSLQRDMNLPFWCSLSLMTLPSEYPCSSHFQQSTVKASLFINQYNYRIIIEMRNLLKKLLSVFVEIFVGCTRMDFVKGKSLFWRFWYRCVGKLFQATLIEVGILTDLFCISVFLLVLMNSCSHYQLM